MTYSTEEDFGHAKHNRYDTRDDGHDERGRCKDVMQLCSYAAYAGCGGS